GHFFGPVFTSPVFGYSHQDYPTLLPAWQALAYLVSGQLTVSWPLQFQLAWLWTAAAIGLVSAVSSQWGRRSLFVAAWICAPRVIYWTMSGCADVPMAFFLVAGVVVLLISPSQPPVVAGLLLGACALSKNEGLPLAVLAVFHRGGESPCPPPARGSAWSVSAVRTGPGRVLRHVAQARRSLHRVAPGARSGTCP